MEPTPAPRGRSSVLLLSALFFTSGATALAAQVALNRLLCYVFGASHLATATVLAAYMGGLSLGAFAFGRLSRRWRRPVAAYGVLELLVAALFALVPLVFPHFQALAIALVRPVQEHHVLLTLVRLVLSFAFVMAPTVLMGATLPTLIAGFDGEAALKRRLPLLYALNTLGGAAGALLSGYVSVPTLGLDVTLWACAFVNALVGLTAIAWRRPLDSSPASTAAADVSEPASGGGLDGGLVAWLAFGQGVLAFVLEVTWSHLIRTAIGVTSYAFTVMLACILLGIGFGSLLVPRLLRRGGQQAAVRSFAGAQVVLAAALAASLYLWDRFPLVIAQTLRWRYEWPFLDRELVRFAYALVLLMPATLALGVALPSLTAAVRVERVAKGGVGRWVGQVLAANTLGGILGALACGFFLLGSVPSSRILGGAAFASLGLAVAAARRGAWSFASWRDARLPLLAAACVLGLALFPGWNRARLTSGNHLHWDFYGGDELNDALLLLQEDATAGFITVERRADGVKVMKSNGKYEGSDEPVEFQDQFALLGALYLERFERAALVGLGPGRTLRILVDMPFRRIDAAELSPGIADVARRQYARFTQPSLADPERVRLHLDDGRNMLQLAEPGYDYVGVGITGAAMAGVGGLYTADFFRLVRSRLDANGVFVMWLQVHHVPPADVRSVVFTLVSVFPHVHFYATPRGDQGFLIASAAPLAVDPDVARRVGEAPYVRRLLELGHRRSLLDLVAGNVFSTPEEIQAFLRPANGESPPVLYTDFWPGFEYRAARGLATRLLFFDFSPWSAARLPEFARPLPPGEEAGLRGLRLRAAGRNREALEALEESERLLGEPAWTGAIQEVRQALAAGQD